jgi:hypothetical protein
MELYIWFFITLSANILIINFSCFFKQLPPFPCRFNFCNTPLLQEVQAPGLKFIWKKQFSMSFPLSRLYLTLTTIKTSEFSTLGRCFLKHVRFRYVTNHLKRGHYRVCSPALVVTSADIRTFVIPRPYYDSSHWNYFRKSSMKEVLK